MLTHPTTQKIVTSFVAVVTVALILLPFVQLANFYWYTPTCFYCGLGLLVLAVLVRAKASIVLAVVLLLWAFAAPFLLLLLPEILLPN